MSSAPIAAPASKTSLNCTRQVTAFPPQRGHPLRPAGYPAQRRMEPWFAFAWSLAQWAVRTARHAAAPALAQFPPTCRDALLVCAGAMPAYYPPGDNCRHMHRRRHGPASSGPSHKGPRWNEVLQYSLQGGEATLDDAIASQPPARATR